MIFFISSSCMSPLYEYMILFLFLFTFIDICQHPSRFCSSYAPYLLGWPSLSSIYNRCELIPFPDELLLPFCVLLLNLCDSRFC